MPISKSPGSDAPDLLLVTVKVTVINILKFSNFLMIFFRTCLLGDPLPISYLLLPHRSNTLENALIIAKALGLILFIVFLYYL